MDLHFSQCVEPTCEGEQCNSLCGGPTSEKNEATGMKNELQLQEIDRHRSKQADLQVKEMKSVFQKTMGDSSNIRLVIQ